MTEIDQTTLAMLDAIAEKVRSAQHIVVLTGAGISAESGMPTFRNAQTGLWSNFRVEDLATVDGFRRDAASVWNWYAERHAQALQNYPNPGHLALAEIERRVPAFDLITQNIDGLHQRAGSQRVIEIHGSLARVKCFDHQHMLEYWPEPEPGAEVPPRCPRCQSKLRPDVVWFGEMLDEEVWLRAIQAMSTCDLFFSIGTSGVVEPAASLVKKAERLRAAVVINNLEVKTLSTHRRYQLNGSAGVLFPLIVEAAWPEKGT